MAPVRSGMASGSIDRHVLELDSHPARRVDVILDVARYRQVLGSLVLVEFTVRYKRAALGVLWLVAVPLLQSALLVAILAKAKAFGDVPDFGAYVLSGLLPWAYFAGALPDGATGIVSGAALADKVWFPRALLPLVDPLSSIAALTVSMVVLLVVLPILGVPLSARLLLLFPACGMLIALTIGLSLVLAALHVYIRDVRHLVSAALLLWFYASPIFYPRSALGGSSWLLDLNPFTGILDLFRMATIDSGEQSVRAIAVTIGVIVVLFSAALEIYRRCDRTLVDRL